MRLFAPAAAALALAFSLGARAADDLADGPCGEGPIHGNDPAHQVGKKAERSASGEPKMRRELSSRFMPG